MELLLKTKYNGAFCHECKAVFDECNPFWSWQKSQAMHERGTGHKMKRFNYEKVDMRKLMCDGELVEL